MTRRSLRSLSGLSLCCLAAGALAQSASLEPLIAVTPTYPPAALERGQEGRVEVQLTVAAEGVVQEARVVSATPADVFEAAALDAVRRWRYPGEAGREPLTLTEQVEFSLPRANAAQRAPERVDARSANRDGPRNECIREGSSFNYGDRVEVALLNVCDTAVAVFTCAQGSGGEVGRWVCTSATENLLAPEGNARIGEAVLLEGDSGVTTATVTDRVLVARAPNTEYWWIACEPGDANCRGSARQWARALDRQAASADPQGRSRLTLARSY